MSDKFYISDKYYFGAGVDVQILPWWELHLQRARACDSRSFWYSIPW